MKRKVGIVTFHSATNFGAALQAFALKQQVENMGFLAQIVNYRPLFMQEDYLQSKNMFAYCKKLLQYRIFERFRNKYLNMTNRIFRCINDFAFLSADYDYIICGSDQIWNHKITRGLDPVYLLDFPVAHATRIAYAVSMGATSIPSQFRSQFAKALCQFKYVSARESFTRDQIVSNGWESDVPIVLDPTLLPVSYLTLSPSTCSESPYIAMYFVNHDSELELAAIKLREILGIPLINISSYRFKGADKNHYFLNPGRWIDMIKHAKIVCTNSFHATGMAIIFNKIFYTIGLHGGNAGLNNRIAELLLKLNLGSRLLHSAYEIPDTSDMILAPIDFIAARKNLNDMQSHSLEFLQEALK